jgi:hypothetical protein
MLGPIVYLLCALAALACATLLLRGYRRTRARLLLWAGLCFVGLTLSNALVVVDLVVVPTRDLFTARNLAALGGLAVLLYGLIWDTK